MTGQRYCVSAAHHDIEAWAIDRGTPDDYALYREAVNWVGAEADRFETFPMLVVERWPQVLEQYRRDGLIDG